MLVDVQVTLATDVKIEKTVSSEQLEHMIEEAYTAGDRRAAVAIEINSDSYVSLTSRSLFVRGSRHSASPSLCALSCPIACRPTTQHHIVQGGN
jgi:hypothetical protein